MKKVEENAGGKQRNEPRHKSERLRIEQVDTKSSNRAGVLQQEKVESHT
jgi:hypothetical protein